LKCHQVDVISHRLNGWISELTKNNNVTRLFIIIIYYATCAAQYYKI